MRHVDLCSGIGGFALGFEWAGLSKPVLFCDIEPWSRQVLAKHWPDVPITDDVKELASDPRRLVPDCEILSCGYPCQPFSQAGKRAGEKDDRHIWPEIFAIIKAKRPSWIVCENVSGHITLGLDQVLSDLEGEGYAIQPFVIPACAVDAPHRRDRVWIVAHTDSHGEPYGTRYAESGERLVAHAGCQRQRAKVSGFGGQSINGSAAGQRTKTRDGFADSRENVADTDNTGNRTQPHSDDRKWQEAIERRQEQSLPKPSGHRENVADTSSKGLEGAEWSELEGNRNGFTTSSEDVADTTSQRQQRQGSPRDASNPTQRGEGQATEFINGGFGDKRQLESRMGDLVDGLPKGLDGFDGWEREPADIPRVATGIKQRAARLKGLGNAIVPQIAMRIGQTIKAVEDGQV
jgi:DNA-cytosine methyltransferase